MTSLRWFILGALACAIALLMLAAAKANAQEVQQQCGPRAGLVKMLAEKLHQAPVAIGMVNDQLIMEAFSSQTGAWTMFITNAQGVSCLVVAGENWQFDTKAFDDAKKGPWQ